MTVQNIQSLTAFVWMIFFAVLAAAVYTFLVQSLLSRFVRRLFDAGADSPENAKTLAQLGYREGLCSLLVRTFAGGGSPLARAVVKQAPDKQEKMGDELLFAEKTEISYYFPAENRTKSFEKHYSERVPLVKMAGLFVLLAVAAFAATGVIRFLGNWASNVVSSDSKKDAYGTVERDDSLLDEQEKLNREEEERLKQEQAKAEAEKAGAEDGTDVSENSENAENISDTDSSSDAEKPKAPDSPENGDTQNPKAEK